MAAPALSQRGNKMLDERQAIPILMYHSVDGSCSDAYRPWMLKPAVFDEHMNALAELNFTAMTVSSLVAAVGGHGSLPARPVVITFDDGFRDFQTGALPILQRYGFCATLYVVSGYVGGTGGWLQSLGEGDRTMLDWSELREVASSGIEVGAHTVTHPQLDTMGRQAAFNEILGSKLKLEDNLGGAVRTFAYPHGYASARTRALVQEAGFESACRVRHALSAASEDPFGLSRVMVTADTTLGDLKQFVTGNGLPVAPPADRLAARAWRLARRVQRWRGLATAGLRDSFSRA